MKQIWSLLSLVLVFAPVALPATAVAGPMARAGFDEAVLMLAGNKKSRDDDDRSRSGSNRQRDDDDRRPPARQVPDRQLPDRQPSDRQVQKPQSRQVQSSGQDRQRFDGGGQLQNRDDRINRAMQVAARRGRVLDAGPQSGSVFWVRVATDHGRVDLLVDADSGRIIGER
ncbi:MAG: hypothetical protein QM647_01875 [Asticcacaulis sp.]|uniref:hypothetical protein n=1 Tax=Asticcacaulis sp. TaxID=1872648 RepID=UPI0039E64559